MLHGVLRGRRVYRLTVLFRAFGLKPGEIVRLNDERSEVLELGKAVRCRELGRSRKKIFKAVLPT